MPQKRAREDADDVDVTELKDYLKGEEAKLRDGSKEVLNQELIRRIKAVKALDARVTAQTSYAAGLESGVAQECRAELTACFRVGVRLESWLNTYTPPLASGGNVGVSGEVQEALYGNVHSVTLGCGEALHRMLAFEKEHAVMRTKCTDDKVWERYKPVLEDNQLHDLCKSVMQLHSDLLMIGNSICNNLHHINIKEDKAVAMY